MKTKVSIIIPIYYGNLPELDWSIKTQVDYFRKNLKEYDWKIIISLNGEKKNEIWNKIQELCEKYPEVGYFYTSNQGKGYGVIEGLTKFNTDINAFMDVDLATDLTSFKPMIQEIERGYDLSMGSRYHPASRTKRSFKRWFISKTYNIFLLNLMLGIKVNEAQCGFKAMNSKVINEVLPHIENMKWFFDTELIYIAHKKGCKIREIPVIWNENDISGVPLFKTAIEFIKNAYRIKKKKY